MAENKKIKNATKNTVDGINFKSRLEAMIYKTLKEQGFNVEYEPKKFVIWKGYIPTVPFYDKDPKTGLLKPNRDKLIDMTYTPDFCLTYGKLLVIIEAKGLENDRFPIKKKMFRKYLEKYSEYFERPVVYFELYSKKQLLQAIELIKIMEKIIQIRGMLEFLPTKKDQKIANDLLDKRKFVELKELVDSDVRKLSNRKLQLIPKIDDDGNLLEEPSKEYTEAEERYNKLKELQAEVDIQAAAFEDPDEESYYIPEDYD